MVFDFIFIEPQQRFYRPHGAFSQGTERTTLDIFHLVLEHRQIVVGRLAELDSVEQPGDGGQTISARCAPAAAFAGEELVEVAGYRHHAGVFVKDCHARCTEAALDLFKRIEVHHHVKVIGGQVWG